MSEQRGAELAAQLQAATEARSELAASVARLERKVALLTRERDGLKQIIQSYDEEDGSQLAAQGAIYASKCMPAWLQTRTRR